MSEHLRIVYRLVGTGWSECIIETEGARVEVTASYLSHALGNLVLAAIAVASSFRTVEFGFDEEPGEYRWVLSAEGNNGVRLRILEFPELWGNEPNEKGRCMLEALTTPVLFAKAVHDCANGVLQAYGLKGYAEKWSSHPFPEQEVALLQHLIARWEQ